MMFRYFIRLSAFILCAFILTACEPTYSRLLETGYTNKKPALTFVFTEPPYMSIMLTGPQGAVLSAPKISDPDGLISKALRETRAEIYDEVKNLNWFTIKQIVPPIGYQKEVILPDLHRQNITGLVAIVRNSVFYNERNSNIGLEIYDLDNQDKEVYRQYLQGGGQAGWDVAAAIRKSADALKIKIREELYPINLQ